MRSKFLIFILFLMAISVNTVAEEIDTIEEEFFNTAVVDNKETKDLNIEQELMIMTTDPIKLTDSYSRRIIGMIYEPLFNMDSRGKITPNLVEEYKWNDPNKLYIKLKPNIKFHNGKTLTSKDVEFSLNRLKEDGVVTDIYESIIGVEIIDDLSFVINLKSKDNQLLTALTNSAASIVCEDNGILYGTGPYSIDVINFGTLKLKKFNDYHGDEKTPYNSIEIRWELNPNQRLIKYMNGENQIVFDMYEEDISRAKNLGLLDEETIIKSGKIYDSIALMFNDKKYSLVQRKAINDALEEKAETFFPEELLKANLSRTDKNYDLSKVKNELKESGLEDKEINIMLLNSEHNMKIAEKVKKNLEKLGLKVNIYPHNLISFYQKLYSRNYDIALYNINISGMYPILSLEKIILSDIGDKEVAGALLPFLELIKKENNPQKANKIFDKVLSLIQKNNLYIPIEHRATYYLGEEKNIDNFEKIVGY